MLFMRYGPVKMNSPPTWTPPPRVLMTLFEICAPHRRPPGSSFLNPVHGCCLLCSQRPPGSEPLGLQQHGRGGRENRALSQSCLTGLMIYPIQSGSMGVGPVTKGMQWTPRTLHWLGVSPVAFQLALIFSFWPCMLLHFAAADRASQRCIQQRTSLSRSRVRPGLRWIKRVEHAGRAGTDNNLLLGVTLGQS